MPQIIKVDPLHPQKIIIQTAARIIRKGGLVVFPTETVYGIAANLRNSRKLDEIKNRPKNKHYTIHIAYKKDVRIFIKSLNNSAKRIIKELLPGPVTLILQADSGRKIGFRMPDNKIALELIRAVGEPIIASSANISGKSSPVKLSQVCMDVDLILDSGITKYRKDSTILDITAIPPKIIRRGCFAAVIGKLLK